MPAAQLQISSNNIVNPVGGLSIANLTLTALNPISVAGSFVFGAPGFQTVAVPAGASWVIIVPPVTNTTVGLTLKGITGDTGIPLDMNGPSVIALAGTGNIGITASAAITVYYSFT